MTYLLWAFYLIGGLLSVWKRATLSAQHPTNDVPNIKAYFVMNGPSIAISFLISSGLFWVIWHDTSSLSKMLAFVGVQKDFDVPLNPLTAAIYGVFSDQISDLIVTTVSRRFGGKQ